MKNDEIIFEKTYDFRGLKCPLPVLKTRRALKSHHKGQVIKILSDDPAANLDFIHFCEVSGNILLENVEEDKNLIFFIKKI